MTPSSEFVEIGNRTRESLRLHARDIATKLRSNMAQLVPGRWDNDVAALGRLVSLCGNLDQLHAVVGTTLQWHPPPLPDDLVELHRRIGDCIGPVTDFAMCALEPRLCGVWRDAALGPAKVEELLALVDPAEPSEDRAARPASGGAARAR